MLVMSARADAKSSALYIRTEEDLLRALDEEAAAMSAQTGLKVSRSDIARLILRRGLAHRLEPAPPPPASLASPAPAAPAKRAASAKRRP